MSARETVSEAMTFLYLVRHGATAANENIPFILQGDGIDLPLSPRGEEQATAVGKLLSREPVVQVYSSHMLRARQTAAAIAGPHRLEVQPLDHLQECNVGAWEGLDWHAIQRDYPEEHRRFMQDPGEHASPGGESYRDVLQRVEPVLSGLLRQHAGERIVVVGHTVVNRVYLAHLLGVDLRLSMSVRQSNGGVNVIRSYHGQLTVMSVNSVFHLPEMPV